MPCGSPRRISSDVPTNPLCCFYKGYVGIYWGYIGIMEKKMETIRIIGIIIGYILGLYNDNGKENGSYLHGIVLLLAS